jgi:4-hydroxy-3-methylbut-2-en-1-yl diphosphate reductase
MEIVLASDMGFCFGVRRAVEMAEKAAAESDGLASLGSIVHNQQVVERLAAMGVRIIRNAGEAGGRSVIIPSHGVAPAVLAEISRLGLPAIDATCPIVKRSQQWAKRLASDGYAVVIFGNPEHPEVRGVLGWAGDKAMALPDEEALQSLAGPLPSRIAVLSQTTQTEARFASFVERLVGLHLSEARELRVINTLCNATTAKQSAAQELARSVDLMIVVGGRESANTRHLAEVARAEGVETHQVEGAGQIEADWLRGRLCVGVTAGASTPDEAIDAVVARLRELA